MPRKAFDSLSEPMFYVLMALRRSTLCGVEIAEWIGTKTDSRVSLGPGTLYITSTATEKADTKTGRARQQSCRALLLYKSPGV